jgi:hypothetical protein
MNDSSLAPVGGESWFVEQMLEDALSEVKEKRSTPTKRRPQGRHSRSKSNAR